MSCSGVNLVCVNLCEMYTCMCRYVYTYVGISIYLHIRIYMYTQINVFRVYVCKCINICKFMKPHEMSDIASTLRLFLETFNLVPGVPGFSWDSSFITWY